MKRKSRLISCFLSVFLIFQIILPVNSSEKAFADSLISGSVSERQNLNSDIMEDVQDDELDNSQQETNPGNPEELPEETPGEVPGETPNEGINPDETPKEPEVDNEDNLPGNPEEENGENSSPDFEEDLDQEENVLPDETPGVLEGGLYDDPITSWTFSGVEDLNKDGTIDEKDLSLVATRYNALRGQGDYTSDSDFNNDGVIDLFDLVRVSTKIGTKGKIVIDPGHGGSDPGAIGPSGLQEKEITLKVSLKVRDMLMAQGYTVIMTRTTDTYLSLQERCDVANNAEADLFISIHCNSFSDPSANGTETFSYTTTGIGAQAAKSIQSKLVAALGLRNRGHKTADFYVLRNTNMPAALTELAFISNPKEEALLKTEDFQTKSAKAIVDGILGY